MAASRLGGTAYLYPSELSWERGDRGYVCAVFDLADGKLEGTVGGEAR